LEIKIFIETKKEITWDLMIEVVAVDSAEGHGRCTRQFARNVRKNAKSLLSPVMTVRYTARTVFQSVKTKVVKRRNFVSLFLPAEPQKAAF
jgi:inner membrane protein involved in colicin E2 resistance